LGWGSAPDPDWGAYSAPADPLAGYKGPTSKEMEGREGKGKEERKRRAKEGQKRQEGKGKRKRKREGLCSSKNSLKYALSLTLDSAHARLIQPRN